MGNARIVLMMILLLGIFPAAQSVRAEETAPERVPLPGETLHLDYENESDILSDFLSGARLYREAESGKLPKNPLEVRKMALADGRFGKALHVKDGWSASRGTWNESGLDCDLIVATIWGEWRTKPHYWGAGRFHGDRGTVAMWVKTDKLHENYDKVFMQGNIAWGRKERDLFTISVTQEGKLSATMRDVRYRDHTVAADEPTFKTGEWQHVAVAYDRAYGLKLYHNGKLIATNWGKDAWWQTPLPGLFSPFLPESLYDEIYFFDRPLSDEEVASLHKTNAIPEQKNPPAYVLDEAAQKRLLAAYGDVDKMELPTVNAGEEVLKLTQTRIADCHDEKIPAWWVLDGRYELAWPHPYLVFTFILGDVDYHGTQVDLDFAEGSAANYVSFEGNLDGVEMVAGQPGKFDGGRKLVDLNGYGDFFYSKKIDMKDAAALHVPLVKGYGTPPGLVDNGTLKFPLSKDVRIHEIGLWNAQAVKLNDLRLEPERTWFLDPAAGDAVGARYGDALMKLKGAAHRAVVIGTPNEPGGPAGNIELGPCQSVNLFGPDLNPDLAIDSVVLRLNVVPKAKSDLFWIKLRDPSNPSRIWAQSCVRANFAEPGKAQVLGLVVDTMDLMLASEDRLWVEVSSAAGFALRAGGRQVPSAIGIVESADKKKSLAEYARHEIMPARMQYTKEYNYQPWAFEGDPASIKNWSNFGGPYDMVYPPQAVLRHDPTDRLANIYRILTTYRATVYSGGIRSYFVPVHGLTAHRVTAPGGERSGLEGFAGIPQGTPPDAPAWAIWERELYRIRRDLFHWIAQMQRSDGFFWGGCNDDPFFVLGYASLPLMGDEVSRKAFMRFYDGLEEAGIFKDGYCDVWPIDQLHITDFITSRGLMLAYALGDPQVFERELVTAGVYKELNGKDNARRKEGGKPPVEGRQRYGDLTETPKEILHKNLYEYENCYVNWYWNRHDKNDETTWIPKYELTDRGALARRMMQVVHGYDAVALFDLSESLCHTDRQGGAPGRQELVAAALGGRLSGRIEPYPHCIAVSWEGNPSPGLARLVSYATETELRVNLYNFAGEPAKVAMRIWRLGNGLYKIKTGPDENDDGEIDGNANEEQKNLRRFSTIDLTVPPRQNLAVRVTQTKALEQMKDLPDLAVGARDAAAAAVTSKAASDPNHVPRPEGHRIQVYIHNIGTAEAENVVVRLVNKDGVLREEVVKRIAAPVDFKPKTVKVLFKGLDDKDFSTEGLRVVVDPENKLEEIFEENNEIAIVK